MGNKGSQNRQRVQSNDEGTAPKTHVTPTSSSTSGSSKECKIVCVGYAGVGKSTLILRLTTGTFVAEYDPSIEDSFRKQMVVDDHAIVLDILDTAGDNTAMREQYLRSTNAAIICFCPNQKESFDDISSTISQIERVKDVSIESYPVVICATKSDLYADRVVSREDVKVLLKKYSIPESAYFETSAKSGSNVEDPFKQIARIAETSKTNRSTGEVKK